MARAIQWLGPVLGPLCVKALFAAAGCVYWWLGRWCIRRGAHGAVLAVVAGAVALLLGYATTSNLCILVSGQPCLPTWRVGPRPW